MLACGVFWMFSDDAQYFVFKGRADTVEPTFKGAHDPTK